MADYIRQAGIRHVKEVAATSDYMVERALLMRAESYLASVKAQLLTKTIYEIDNSRKRLKHTNQALQSSLERIDAQKRELKQQIELRRKAEERLAAAVAELQLVSDNVREFIVRLDLDGRLLWWNRQLERTTGLSGKQLRNRMWTDLVSADGVPTIETLIETVQTHPEQQIELHLRSTSDSLSPSGPHRINCRLVKSEHGEPIGIVASGLDISAQRRAETALESNEALLRVILDNADEIFWRRDPQTGNFLFVSEGLQRLWGHPIAPILEDPSRWGDIVHPADRERMVQRCRDHRTEQSGEDEYRMLLADGTERCVWERWFPIFDQSSRATCIAGIALDVTTRKEAEDKRLAMAKKHKETLIREIHHRIKNHLQGVTGLLSNRAHSHPQLAPLIDEIISQVESISAVYGLQSRMGSRPSLQSMVKEIVGATERLNGSKVGLEITKGDGARTWIANNWAVPVALVINELLTNASKHRMKDGSDHEIEVTLSCHPTNAELRITNVGCLPEGLSLDSGQDLGTGLQLVRSLLPKEGTELKIYSRQKTVIADLRLLPPVIDITGAEEAMESAGFIVP